MIFNKSQKKLIAGKHTSCNSFFSKALGLMFSKRKSLIFTFNKEQKISLHMFFVFYPIHVILLDKNFKVVEIARLKPFTIYNSKKKAKYALEIPDPESIPELGDEINWK